jgi:hypothetical protein
MMEPCGAIPRRCLFVYLFVYSFMAIRASVLGLTEDSGLAADLLGELDYGGGTIVPGKE